MKAKIDAAGDCPHHSRSDQPRRLIASRVTADARRTVPGVATHVAVMGVGAALPMLMTMGTGDDLIVCGILMTFGARIASMRSRIDSKSVIEDGTLP